MNDRHAPWVEGLVIGQVLRETARRFGDQDALVFPQAGFRRTYRELDALVDDVARGLMALGLERGDHFGVWSTNWPEWVLLQFAAARVGVVLVKINPSYHLAEAQYALAQSEIRGLALIERYKTSDYFEIISELCPTLSTSPPGRLRSDALPHLRWVVAMRGDGLPGMLNWSGFLERGRSISREALAARVTEDGAEWFNAPRIDTANTHGTGCTLSSAIAAGLAKGAPLRKAVAAGKAYVTAAIAASDRLSIGRGRGPVHHFHALWPGRA